MKQFPRIKLGDLTEVVFFDHAQHDDVSTRGLILTKVYGRVIRLDKNYLQIATWEPENKKDTDDVDSYSIALGTIKKLRKLK